MSLMEALHWPQSSVQSALPTAHSLRSIDPLSLPWHETLHILEAEDAHDLAHPPLGSRHAPAMLHPPEEQAPSASPVLSVSTGTGSPHSTPRGTPGTPCSLLPRPSVSPLPPRHVAVGIEDLLNCLCEGDALARGGASKRVPRVVHHGSSRDDPLEEAPLLAVPSGDRLDQALHGAFHGLGLESLPLLSPVEASLGMPWAHHGLHGPSWGAPFGSFGGKQFPGMQFSGKQFPGKQFPGKQLQERQFPVKQFRGKQVRDLTRPDPTNHRDEDGVEHEAKGSAGGGSPHPSTALVGCGEDAEVRRLASMGVSVGQKRIILGTVGPKKRSLTDEAAGASTHLQGIDHVDQSNGHHEFKRARADAPGAGGSRQALEHAGGSDPFALAGQAARLSMLQEAAEVAQRRHILQTALGAAEACNVDERTSAGRGIDVGPAAVTRPSAAHDELQSLRHGGLPPESSAHLPPAADGAMLVAGSRGLSSRPYGCATQETLPGKAIPGRTVSGAVQADHPALHVFAPPSPDVSVGQSGPGTPEAVAQMVAEAGSPSFPSVAQSALEQALAADMQVQAHLRGADAQPAEDEESVRRRSGAAIERTLGRLQGKLEELRLLLPALHEAAKSSGKLPATEEAVASEAALLVQQLAKETASLFPEQLQLQIMVPARKYGGSFSPKDTQGTPSVRHGSLKGRAGMPRAKSCADELLGHADGSPSGGGPATLARAGRQHTAPKLFASKIEGVDSPAPSGVSMGTVRWDRQLSADSGVAGVVQQARSGGEGTMAVEGVRSGDADGVSEDGEEGEQRVCKEEPYNDGDEGGPYVLVEMDVDELLAEHSHFCHICGKGFKRDANLKIHMRGHGNEYKVAPGAGAATQVPSEEHSPGAETVPNKEEKLPRRYSCPIKGCRRNQLHPEFQPLKTLVCVKNHYKRTHGPKTHRCAKCGTKTFGVLADLKTHEKHCGEVSKWVCSCGNTFTRRDKLARHTELFQGHTAVDLDSVHG